MIKSAKRLDFFQEGIFQKLNKLKEERLAKGELVYNYSVGTPDFTPEPIILQTVSEKAKDPENYKYALKDIPELTNAVIKKYRERYQVELKENEITSVYGSQEGMGHIFLSLIDPGDIVLVPNPGYPVFSTGPLLAGAQLISYELDEKNQYLPKLDLINEDILKKASCIIVSYPLNPVGKSADLSFYQELVLWAKKWDILIIHDNAYSEIIFDGRKGNSIFQVEGSKDIAVEFFSLSKTYNYTGARMGFLIGNESVIHYFKKLKSQIDYGTFLPVQYGAVAALTIEQEIIDEQCKIYESRRDCLCDGLSEIGWKVEKSQGTMFVWAKIPKNYSDDEAFVEELFLKTGVLCTPGSSFGTKGKGFVRFALVHNEKVIIESVAKIREAHII